MEYLKNTHPYLRHSIVMPAVSTLIIPIVIMDVWVEIYHLICFPLYRIPYVRREQYIKIDRHKLSYLNPAQKIYCMYCGYANGVLHYWTKIAAETERYWCGIQHEHNNQFFPPAHHKKFTPYGDEQEFRKRYLPTRQK